MQRFSVLHHDAGYFERSKLIMLRVMLLSDQFGVNCQGVSTSSRSPSSLRANLFGTKPLRIPGYIGTGRPGVWALDSYELYRRLNKSTK